MPVLQEGTVSAAGADDLEEGGDEEPSLGSSDRNFDQDGAWAHWTGHQWNTDLEEDNSDNEPSLGWTEDESARGRYAATTPATVDLEEQPDDEGVPVWPRSSVWIIRPASWGLWLSICN